MRSLCPITTPGTPEKLNPETSNAQFAVIVRHLRPTWCQTLGSAAPRWGSFASSGIPLSVRSPDTTHEFEPMPSPASPIRALTASITPSASSHSIEAVAMPDSDAAPALAGCAEVSVGTITGWRSKG